jgi:hypothetical protein
LPFYDDLRTWLLQRDASAGLLLAVLAEKLAVETAFKAGACVLLWRLLENSGGAFYYEREPRNVTRADAHVFQRRFS